MATTITALTGPGPVALRADGSERTRYDHPEPPSYIRMARLGDYMQMRAACHWHVDWEFLVAVEGHLTYFVNGRHIPVAQGQGIVVNSRRLHYGYSADGTDCRFLCVLIDQTRIGAPQTVTRRYIAPLMDGPDHLPLDPSDPHGGAAIDILTRLYRTRADDDSPLIILSGFYELLRHLDALMARTPDGRRTADGGAGTDARIRSLTAMVDYVHAHIHEPITVADIAAAGAVGRSTCSAIFRDNLDQSPIEFVVDVRLRTAAELLSSTNLPVAAVARHVGFRSPAFFSRSFHRHMGMSPTAYRAATRGEDHGADPDA